MAALTPTEIKRVTSENGRGAALEVTWSDGSSHTLPAELLRRSCPCASCLEARGDASHAKPLASKRPSLTVLKAGLDEETDLRQIWVVGSYALGIRWGDGHDTGIYSFQRLRELALTSVGAENESTDRT